MTLAWEIFQSAMFFVTACFTGCIFFSFILENKAELSLISSNRNPERGRVFLSLRPCLSVTSTKDFFLFFSFFVFFFFAAQRRSEALLPGEPEDAGGDSKLEVSVEMQLQQSACQSL